MSNSELLPCPFCGGTDLRQYAFKAALDVHYAVQCYCGARSEGQIDREAVELWNTRAGYTAIDAASADADGYRNGRASVLDGLRDRILIALRDDDSIDNPSRVTDLIMRAIEIEP